VGQPRDRLGGTPWANTEGHRRGGTPCGNPWKDPERDLLGAPAWGKWGDCRGVTCAGYPEGTKISATQCRFPVGGRPWGEPREGTPLRGNTSRDTREWTTMVDPPRENPETRRLTPMLGTLGLSPMWRPSLEDPRWVYTRWVTRVGRPTWGDTFWGTPCGRPVGGPPWGNRLGGISWVDTSGNPREGTPVEGFPRG
jgi:hypothetical protein